MTRRRYEVPRLRPDWLGIGIATIVIAAVLAAVGYDLFQATRVVPLNSDEVQSFLEAGSVLRGNVLLSGWHLAPDNFYFTDTLPFAGLMYLGGRNVLFLKTVPVAVYLLLVGIAASLAWWGALSLRDRIIAFATVIFLIGLPPRVAGYPLLVPDVHMASILLSLASFGALAWFRQTRRGGARAIGAAVFVALAGAAAASDPFVIALALFPAFVVLLVEWLGADGAGNDAVGPFALVLVAIGVGVAIPSVIAASGGFVIEPTATSQFISAEHLGRACIAFVFGLLHLAGADIFGRPLMSPDGLRSLAKLVFWLVALAALVHTVRRAGWRGGGRFLDRLLAAAIIVTAAACISSDMFDRGLDHGIFQGGGSKRYLVPILIFAAVLAARRLPGIVASSPTFRLRAASFGAVAALCLALLVGNTWQAARHSGAPSWTTANPRRMVAEWLTKDGLTHGVGGYWAANITMALGDGALRIRPFVLSHGVLVPMQWITNTRWRAAAERPMFVVWQEGDPYGFHINKKTIAATWGKPKEIKRIGGFAIAVLARKPAE